MSLKDEMIKTIERHALYPVVPGYDYDYYCKWKDGSEQIILNNINEINNFKCKGRITSYYLYTGKKSNIIVLDLDINHGKNKTNGIESFNKIIESLPYEDQEIINTTFTVLTKRHGLQVYFKYTDELNKKLSFDSIDVLTNGCLAPLPGSKRRIDPPDNKKIGTYELLLDYDIKSMPKSLIDVIKSHYKPTKKRGRPTTTSKYYNSANEGNRDNTLISWLGHMIKNNPHLRNKTELMPLAEMYNYKYFSPPLDVSIINEKVESILNYADPPYINGKGKVICAELANTIIYDIKYKYYMGKNYTYNGSYYEEYGTLEGLRQKIHSYLPTDKVSSKIANEVISLMHDKAIVETSKDFEYINVNNGLLNLRTGELLPHNKNIFTTMQIPCDYSTNWEKDFEGSNIQKFLTTTFKNDNELIDMAIDIMGMSLAPNPNKFQKHVLLKGGGNNGKSIFISILRALHGERISSQPTDLLANKRENKFCTSAMVGYRLNLVDDENQVYMSDTGLWKSIITGGNVKIEYKGQTATSGKLNILLISGTNYYFKSNDNSNGFYRRFLILPFNQEFADKNQLNLLKNENALPCDYSLENKIINKEMHIVLGLALKGLKRVIKRGYKFKNIKATNETMKELKCENNPVYEFVLYLQKGEYTTNYIYAATLFKIYETWCKDYGKHNIGSNTFGKQFKDYYKCKESHGIKYFNVDITEEYLYLLLDSTGTKYLKKESTIQYKQTMPNKQTGWREVK
ncbi:MAG: hypothetical protein GX309_06175 [Clostridiales bacterium]|nr:hypothetical protein [Clostridiales bacterium]